MGITMRDDDSFWTRRLLIAIGIAFLILVASLIWAQVAKAAGVLPIVPRYTSTVAGPDEVRYFTTDGDRTTPATATLLGGCSSRSRTYSAALGLMHWRVTASGCWNAAHTKVTSFSIGASGDATLPYRYSGIIGREPIGAIGSHQVGKQLTARFDSCVPPFGCVSTWQPWARFILDSYGNWDIHP